MNISDYNQRPRVTPAHVRMAWFFMKEGFDPQQSARIVGVMFNDLNRALNNSLGDDKSWDEPPRRPEPMF